MYKVVFKGTIAPVDMVSEIPGHLKKEYDYIFFKFMA